MAMMLWHRIANGIGEPRTFRYLTYDASPQGGVEIFCTAERVVTFSRDLANSVVIRRLPLVQLGHAHLGVADKAQALMHQVWLDYGPAAVDIEKANNVCRQNLSDMGHEFDIADSRNILDKCLGPERRGKLDVESAERLFPNSLAVPGIQHILDSVLEEGVQILPWWKAWEKACKNVSGFARQDEEGFPEATFATKLGRGEGFKQYLWKLC